MNVRELLSVVPDSRGKAHSTLAQHVQCGQLLRQGHGLTQWQRKRSHPESYTLRKRRRSGQGDQYLVDVGGPVITKSSPAWRVQMIVAPAE